jgi:hypothetical protein
MLDRGHLTVAEKWGALVLSVLETVYSVGFVGILVLAALGKRWQSLHMIAGQVGVQLPYNGTSSLLLRAFSPMVVFTTVVVIIAVSTIFCVFIYDIYIAGPEFQNRMIIDILHDLYENCKVVHLLR